MAVAYLSGGNDITTGIREFRESWHTRAVSEGVVSGHVFDLASKHYRTLFDADPEGEEALLVCEYYIRERMPAAMQEIEQNAARAALLGNLIIPMLAWVAAALVGIVLAVVNGSLLAALMQLVLFAALFALFPYIVGEDLDPSECAHFARRRCQSLRGLGRGPESRGNRYLRLDPSESARPVAHGTGVVRDAAPLPERHLGRAVSVGTGTRACAQIAADGARVRA